MTAQQMLLGSVTSTAAVIPNIAFVKSEAMPNGTGSHTITGIQTDDLVIVAAVAASVSPAIPTGFNIGFQNTTLANPGRNWCYLFATGTSMTVSGLSSVTTGLTAVNYICTVFRNVSKDVPFTINATATGTSATITPPAASAIFTNQVAVLLGMLDNDNIADTSSLAAPAGYTLTAKKDTGTDGVNLGASGGSTVMSAYKVLTASGTETPGGFTSTIGNDAWAGYTLLLGPANAINDTTTVSSQTVFTTTGANTWTVPADVRRVSAVVVGGGGGGAGSRGDRDAGNTGGAGGALAYGSFVVIPGETLTVNVAVAGAAGANDASGGVGGNSTILRSGLLLLSATGGLGGVTQSTGSRSGGVPTWGFGVTISGGGNGGISGAATDDDSGGGGGGAGGYSGNGGTGGITGAGPAGTAGAGGGGGGAGSTNSGQGYSGGGTGVLGQASDGTGGAQNANGLGGSGGANGTQTAGGIPGGGGGARDDDSAGAGCAGARGEVRIIWGTGRAYPSTNTANV
jgi:hypothetical protein